MEYWSIGILDANENHRKLFIFDPPPIFPPPTILFFFQYSIIPIFPVFLYSNTPIILFLLITFCISYGIGHKDP